MNMEEYTKAGHDFSAVTNDNLNILMSHPAKWHRLSQHNEEQAARTESQKFSVLAHDRLLMDELAFKTAYLESDGPINPKTNAPYGSTTKTYAEWLASVGKPVVSSKQAVLLAAMDTAFREAVFHVSGGAEVRTRQFATKRVDGIDLVCLADMAVVGKDGRPETVIDVKMTSDLDSIANRAVSLGYANHLAFLRQMFDCRAVTIVIEKGIPSRTLLMHLSEPTYSRCERALAAAVSSLARGRGTGVWENPLTGKDIEL